MVALAGPANGTTGGRQAKPSPPTGRGLDCRRGYHSLAWRRSARRRWALRIWPVFVLGHRFSGLVAIQPGHKLVTSGVYGVIRHPSYLGLLVNSLGWALAFRSGVGLLLTVLLIPPLVVRIRAEERMLRTEFGGKYDVYCSRTWRFIPGFY